MIFFYSSGSMAYGNGWWWHKYFNFPHFPRVTKTITANNKIGMPFAIFRAGNTIFNKMSLPNKGIMWWINSTNHSPITTVSIAGTDDEIENMVYQLNIMSYYIPSIELNFSCPNVKSYENKRIPHSTIPLYLKLNHTQDPYKYDLNMINGIRVNSVPCIFGGMSGRAAQKYNWNFIKKFNYEGLNVAGSSFLSINDILFLKEYCGCSEIGIGSTILLKPSLIESLIYLKNI